MTAGKGTSTGRVLIVIRQFFPLAAGAETQALRQAQSYIELGHWATVVTARHDTNLPARDIVDGVPVVRLRTLPLRFAGSLCFLAYLAFYLVSHCRDYDSVLAFHVKQPAALVAVLCAFLGKRVIISDQAAGKFGDIEALRNAPLGNWILRCCRRALGFISGSSDITEELVAAGIPGHRIHFIPNGIPVDEFSQAAPREAARRALAIPDDAFVAVNVGRHSAQKDLKTLLAGWLAFAPSHANALLVLVGDGDERGELETIAAESGVSESIRFEGWRKNVPEYLAAADIFVASSISEGTHIALGEAMAAALPVLATAVGGARDFVREGENGFLFPVGDGQELAGRLTALAEDAKRRTAMGRKARETALAVLEQTATAQRHLEVLFPAVNVSPHARKIRITHLIATLDRGGSEQQMAALAAGLDRDVFDVDVICLTRGGPVENALAEAGVPYRILGKAGKVDPQAFFRLVSLLSERTPDVLHTWLFTSNTYGRTAAALAGVRHVVSSERSTDPWKRHVHRGIDLLLSGLTDRIVANSSAVAASLTSNGIRPRHVTVIPNSVDTRRFSVRDARDARFTLGLPVASPLIGYVGRLAFEKRPEVFLEAAKSVLNGLPEAKAVLFGNGPMEEELKRAAAGLGERVIFYGDTSKVELAHAAIDCLVLTSSWEGFPNAVLEAMSCARPVVAVRMPATGEVIDGETGFLTGDSPSDIAEAVTRVLADANLAARMGRAGRRKVESLYSVEAMVAAYEALYMDVTGIRRIRKDAS